MSASPPVSVWDWKHFLLSHIPWIVLFVCAALGVHYWLAEHDASLQARATVKLAQSQIVTLQQGIVQRDAQTQQQVAPIIKIIHDVQTPAQAVAALPQIISLPSPAIPQANNSVLIPPDDAIPLFQAVADDKVCRALLTTATADLADEKGIVGEKDKQIVALKAKPKFWARVGHDAKVVGITAAAIGVAVLVRKF